MLLRGLCLEKWLKGFSTLISKRLLTPILIFDGVPILGVAKQWHWPHLLRSPSILFFKLTICQEQSREVVELPTAERTTTSVGEKIVTIASEDWFTMLMLDLVLRASNL